MSKAKAAPQKARVFIPLMKMDEEQRLVYGRITQEELDKAGEVMDYTTSKPLFEKWSAGVHTASNGLSKGNVRVMHGMVAAGKLTELDFNDDDQAIDVCAKIVDDNEWQKCLEGVYTGFSVGGSYVKRWTETIDGVAVKKYTASPLEVSIVDNPCVTSATFALLKADGATEDRMFKNVTVEGGEGGGQSPGDTETEQQADTDVDQPAQLDASVTPPTNIEIAAKATEIADLKKDDSKWVDHIDEAREFLIKAKIEGQAEKTDAKKEKKGDRDKPNTDPSAAVEDQGPPAKDAKDKMKSDDANKSVKVTPPGVRQVWTASDGKTFEKKAEAEAYDETLTKIEDTPAEALRKALARAAEGIAEAEQAREEPSVFDDFDRLHKAFVELDQPRQADGSPALEKGMYTVSRFANLLASVSRLGKDIKSEGAQEGDGDDESIGDALKASLSSFSDNFMTYAKQQVAELLAGMDDDVSPACCSYYYRAAATEGADVLTKDVAEMIKAVENDVPTVLETMTKAWGGTVETAADVVPLAKFTKLEGEHEELKKASLEAVEQVTGLVKRVKALEDTPLPRAPTGHIVEKTEGSGLLKGATTHDEKLAVVQDLLKTHGPDALATMMIKAVHESGGQKLSLSQ